MRLYDADATSPRRVRILLAEKGIAIPIQKVDLASGEQFTPAYKQKNPRCTVPTLELDDGSCLWDTLAICEYIEALHPALPMFGKNPEEHARVVMWYQRVEEDGFHAVAEAFRNGHPFFKERAVTGAATHGQIPELAKRGQARIAKLHRDLDERLGESDFVAGPFFSFADIQLQCVIEFGARRGRTPIPDECKALAAWYARVDARPSARA